MVETCSTTFIKKNLLFLLFCIIGFHINSYSQTIGWTASSNATMPSSPSCNNWSNTWCAGSGTYSELSLVEGVNYTVENTGTVVCSSTALATASLQAWWQGGTTSCNFGAIDLPGTNTITFNAEITGTHRIGLSTNTAGTAANTCGGGTGHDFTGKSAVLRYRQNTTISNTTNIADLCDGTTRNLTAVLAGGHNNPEVIWSIENGPGSIVGTTYEAAGPGTVTIRAMVGNCFDDVTFNVVAAATSPNSIDGINDICYNTTTTLTAMGGVNSGTSTFEWGTGTVPGQNIIPGANTNTYTTPPLTATTNYWVRRYDANNACNVPTTNAAFTTVKVSIPEEIESISVCSNQMPLIWNGITVNSAGNGVATFQTTNALGCDSTAILNLTVLPSPEVDLGPDAHVCSGQTYFLDATYPNCTYAWNTGATSSTLTVTQTGNYSVIVTNNVGCVAKDTVFVIIDGVPPTSGGVQVSNIAVKSFKFKIYGPTNLERIEWDFGDNSPISQAMEPTHTYQDNGNYLVKAKLFSDCGYIFDSSYVFIVGIDNIDYSSQDLKLYPNPNNGLLNINYSGNAKLHSIEIYNILGQKIYESPINGNNTQLNLQALSNGMYQILIHTDKGKLTKKIEIRR